jgi:hypothetical protein
MTFDWIGSGGRGQTRCLALQARNKPCSEEQEAGLEEAELLI